MAPKTHWGLARLSRRDGRAVGSWPANHTWNSGRVLDTGLACWSNPCLETPGANSIFISLPLVPECLGTWRLNEGTVAALLWIDSQGEEKLGRKQFKAGEGSWNRSVPSRAGGKREVAVVTNSAVSGGEMGGLAIQGRACCACELSFVSSKKKIFTARKRPSFAPCKEAKMKGEDYATILSSLNLPLQPGISSTARQGQPCPGCCTAPCTSSRSR